MRAVGVAIWLIPLLLVSFPLFLAIQKPILLLTHSRLAGNPRRGVETGLRSVFFSRNAYLEGVWPWSGRDHVNHKNVRPPPPRLGVKVSLPLGMHFDSCPSICGLCPNGMGQRFPRNRLISLDHQVFFNTSPNQSLVTAACLHFHHRMPLVF